MGSFRGIAAEDGNSIHFEDLRPQIVLNGYIRRMDLRHIFATNLRLLRHAKGLSQEALASDADVDRSYVSRLECGIPYVSLDIVGRLVDALECDAADFFRRPERGRR
jgi:DNA-binding XRE family transcriptional regulator